RQPNSMQLPAGWIEFRVACRGTRIAIEIFGFEGPDAPGPNGGTWQPCPADDFVLGVRGSGEDFIIVTFYGPMRPIPAGSIFITYPEMPAALMNALRKINYGFNSTRLPAVDQTCLMPKRIRTDIVNRMLGNSGTRHLVSILKPVIGESAKGHMT